MRRHWDWTATAMLEPNRLMLRKMTARAVSPRPGDGGGAGASDDDDKEGVDMEDDGNDMRTREWQRRPDPARSRCWRHDPAGSSGDDGEIAAAALGWERGGRGKLCREGRERRRRICELSC